MAHSAAGHAHQRHIERPYPGTCRHGLRGRTARSWRFATTDFMQKQAPTLTHQAQDATFSIASDGLWAYQLAVVVDDAAQGITHVVRGEDLADNTPRQILLQQALQQPTPQYLHTPLVRGADGEKLSKQHGAAPLVLDNPLQALQTAAQVLGLPVLVHPDNTRLGDALSQWVKAWMPLYNRAL